MSHRGHLVADGNRRNDDRTDPGSGAHQPGSGTLPLPGIIADVVDLREAGTTANQEGFLMIRKPWPSMVRTSGVIPSVSKKPIGVACRASTSPAMPRGETTTATTGSSAASTT